MAAPAIQIMVNAEQMKIFWNFDPTTYKSYNVYYSASSTMAGEALLKLVPNIADGTYSKSHVIHSFRRSSISYNESITFYMRLKGILLSTGAEDSGNPGPTKYVPAVSDEIPVYRPVLLYANDGNVWRKAAANTAGKLDVV